MFLSIRNSVIKLGCQNLLSTAEVRCSCNGYTLLVQSSGNRYKKHRNFSTYMSLRQNILLQEKSVIGYNQFGINILRIRTSFERYFHSDNRKLEKVQKSILHVKEKIKAKASDLRENILTVPNLLCLTRIGLAPILGYLVVIESYPFACGIFAVAGLTDLLDGWIARTFPGQQSNLGSALDPVADKFLISILVLSLTYVGLIPVPLTGLIITRDVCLLGGGFVIRYLTLPEPKTFGRYFDPTIVSAKMHPTFISKINTAVQLSLVALTLGAPIFVYTDSLYLQGVWYLTATTTVISGLSYCFGKNRQNLLRNLKGEKTESK